MARYGRYPRPRSTDSPARQHHFHFFASHASTENFPGPKTSTIIAANR
jgi:hypothetical protein